jgi:chromosome segregation ATPase
MEPIRPDEDELRATRETDTEQRQGKKPEKSARPPGNGGKRSPGPLYLLVLLIVAGVGAAGWHQQNQRIEQMESQLEEADYWARQSKLALARFEGELSETGEDLQEAGQSIEQQLSAQAGRLDEADSEIRKLWGVANDRNKSRLNDHEARLEALDTSVQGATSKRQALASEIDAVKSSATQEIAAQGKRIDSQQSTLDQLTESVAAVDKQVENQLKRFQREQSLTIDGLEGWISSLEKTTQALSGGEIQSIRSELSTLKQTVSSIDASRAQLTSRLVRLSEEVSQLRSQAGNQ